MRNHSNWIEGLLEQNKSYAYPEKFLRWAAVSAVAGALERRTWIYYKNAQIYPNLFIMLIGPPGSGKSKSAGEAMRYLACIKELSFSPNDINPASFITYLEEVGARKSFSYKGIEYRHSATFLYASEAINTLGEKYGSIIKLLTDLYDCGHNGWHKDKAWHKTTKGSGDERIFNPCINMLACTTLEWLTDFIDVKDLRGGFSSRNLFIHESSYNTDLIEWKDETEEEQVSKEFNRGLIADLQQIAQLKGKFTISEEVRKRAPLVEQQVAIELSEDPANRFNHFKVRKFWNILKLAQILSASESSRMIIEWKHFERAQAMLEEFMKDLPTLFSNIGRNKDAPVLAEMDEWMRGSEWFSQSDFMANFRNEMRVQDLTATWKSMTSAGALIYKIEGTKILYKLK